jgi:NADPH:quinone reductase
VRTVVCPELGPLSGIVIEDRPAPEPRAGQVVVDVKAAGVNFVDGLICQGKYQLKPATPFVPGMEIAGVVAGTDQRVLAMTGFGGFSSQVAVAEAALLPIPDTIDFAQAAALIQSYGTAMFTFSRRTTVRPDEWVLVLGAGGGVGLAAIDVAVALGAHVIAAASSVAKLDAARSMGAEATIAYESEDLKTRARELSGGGVDVVFDPVGGAHSEQALRATKWFGRFCVIGFASGSISGVPLNQVLLNNRTVIGVDWGAWTIRDPDANRAMLNELMAMVGDGRLHPPRPQERPLEDAAAVMTDLLDRKIAGKVVLVP